MNFKFIDGEMAAGKIMGFRFFGDMSRTLDAGKYVYGEKEIIIVRQKYWYMTLFILLHESTHWIIDCIFPYKEENEFGLNIENGDLQYIYLKQFENKTHFLHNILDKYWKVPKSWLEDK